MSYLEIENKDFYNDINRRKEFIENKAASGRSQDIADLKEIRKINNI